MENKKLRLPWAALLFAIVWGFDIVSGLWGIKNLILGNREFNSESIVSIIYSLSIVALVVTLFKNQRGVFTFSAIAFHFIFPIFFSYISLHEETLYSISAIALVGFALVACDLSFVKIDAGIASSIKKLWSLPGILITICCIKQYSSNMDSVVEFMMGFMCEYAIYVVAWFLLGYWLVNPYVESKTESADVQCSIKTDGYCSIGKLVVLSLFTFGIWPLIWNHRTTKFLNQAPDAQYHNPTKKLLLCMFVPFYQIYWYHKQAQRADAWAQRKNPNHSSISTLCLVCAIFIPIVSSVVLQGCINSICTTPSHMVTNNDLQTADALERYKELLDNGTISQEEYDAKKKQLLGL